MSPKLPKPPSVAEIAAKQGDDIDARYHPSAAVRPSGSMIAITLPEACASS